LRLQLTVLDAAMGPGDIKPPGWRLHPLKGQLADHWSIEVNGNWRLIFAFNGNDVVLVDYSDYH
jgi:proteic killer suppression protein